MSSSDPDPRHRRGRQAEKIAARELKRRGYRILATNWRCPIGEVDIIAREGGDVVLVEVKARTTEGFGGPEAAVHLTKQRKLSRLLDHWLAQAGEADDNYRFDIVALVLDPRGRVTRFTVYPDAFDYHPD